MGSTRFPGKSMKPLGDYPLLYWSIRNAKLMPEVKTVVLATTTLEEDDVLAQYAKRQGISVVRGSESNVLSRFVRAAEVFGASHIVRLTADNPLTPLDISQKTIREHLNSAADYTSTIDSGTLPKGCDIECISADALSRLSQQDLTTEELEHVTLGFKTRGDEFVNLSLSHEPLKQRINLSVDTKEDLAIIQTLLNHGETGWTESLSNILSTWNRAFPESS